MKRIINAICGPAEDLDEPKTMTGCYLYKGESESDIEEIGQINTYRAIIEIKPTNSHVQMDIIFPTEKDGEFLRMVDMLNQMSEETAKCILEQKSESYAICFNFMPLNSDLFCSIEAVNPILYCITALAPGEPIKTIRMLFDPENVNFYESNNIDVVRLDTEINIEMQQKQNALMRQAEARAKRLAEAERRYT